MNLQSVIILHEIGLKVQLLGFVSLKVRLVGEKVRSACFSIQAGEKKIRPNILNFKIFKYEIYCITFRLKDVVKY